MNLLSYNMGEKEDQLKPHTCKLMEWLWVARVQLTYHKNHTFDMLRSLVVTSVGEVFLFIFTRVILNTTFTTNQEY